MKRVLSGRLAVSILTLAVGAGSVLAQGQSGQAPGRLSDDLNSRIVVHSTNPIDTAPTAGGTGSLSPIISHGGPVMGAAKAYLIWYGNWNQSNASDTPGGQAIVRDFLHGAGGSPYYLINSSYAGVSGSVTFAGETTNTGTLGTRLSDSGIRTIVVNAISSGALGPADPNGVYFVLTSSNVSERSGFCTQYCGWHTYTTVGNTAVKYAFVGNANRCLNACAAQTVGPNGNAGVDGMVSVIAHELEEANTDPQLNAWFDSSGAENADKCAWTFGGSQTLLSNGAYYNMTIGARNYLIQRNLATDNKCYVNWLTKAQ
jgi:Phosphate-induced protein 1 conserved region